MTEDIECGIPTIACRSRFSCNDTPLTTNVPFLDINGLPVYHDDCKQKQEGKFTLKQCAQLLRRFSQIIMVHLLLNDLKF